MWVDHEPVDDGYISMYMMRVHEIYVFEVQIETQCYDGLFRRSSAQFPPWLEFFSVIVWTHSYDLGQRSDKCYCTLPYN